MRLTGIDLLLWVVSFCGHVALLSLLVVRNRVRMFPVFSTFIAAAIFRTIALFLVRQYGSQAAYFYAYWSFAAIIDVLLQLGIAIEICLRIFQLAGRIPTDVRKQLLYWTAGSTLLAIISVHLATPPKTPLLMQRIIMKGSVSSSVLISGLFAGMVWLSVRNGFPLKTHVAQICEGFGVYSLSDVLIEAAHTYFGLRQGNAIYIYLSRARIIVYLLCLAYWLGTLWKDTPMPQESTEQVRSDLAGVQKRAENIISSIRERDLL